MQDFFSEKFILSASWSFFRFEKPPSANVLQNIVVCSLLKKLLRRLRLSKLGELGMMRISILKHSWSLHQPPFSSPFYPRFKWTKLCTSCLYSIGESIWKPSSLSLNPEKFERDKYSKSHKLKTCRTSLESALRAWVEEKKRFFTFNFFILGHLLANFSIVQLSNLSMTGLILSIVSSSRRPNLFLEAKKSNKKSATSFSQFNPFISTKLITFFPWSRLIYWEICFLRLDSETAYFITPSRITAPLTFIVACKVRSVSSEI